MFGHEDVDNLDIVASRCAEARRVPGINDPDIGRLDPGGQDVRTARPDRHRLSLEDHATRNEPMTVLAVGRKGPSAADAVPILDLERAAAGRKDAVDHHVGRASDLASPLPHQERLQHTRDATV